MTIVPRGAPLPLGFREAIKQAYSHLLSKKKTARLLGISKHAVKNALKERNGIERRGRKKKCTPEIDEVIKDIIHDNLEFYIKEVVDELWTKELVWISKSTM